MTKAKQPLSTINFEICYLIFLRKALDIIDNTNLIFNIYSNNYYSINNNHFYLLQLIQCRGRKKIYTKKLG